MKHVWLDRPRNGGMMLRSNILTSPDQ